MVKISGDGWVFITVTGLLLVMAYLDGFLTDEYAAGYNDAINSDSALYESLGGDAMNFGGMPQSYYWYKNGYQSGKAHLIDKQVENKINDRMGED